MYQHHGVVSFYDFRYKLYPSANATKKLSSAHFSGKKESGGCKVKCGPLMIHLCVLIAALVQKKIYQSLP
jgi:hypothetical protein